MFTAQIALDTDWLDLIRVSVAQCDALTGAVQVYLQTVDNAQVT